MKNLTVKKIPDRILRQKTAVITKITVLEKDMLSEMAKIMYVNGGIGLAANQVGIDKQLAVIDVGNGLIKLINPIIVKKEGTESMEEGCLSIPGASVNVKRARKVTIDYLNENGEAIRLSADGLFARAIQHEIDHLSGKMIVDYLSPIKKIFLRTSARKG